jgi:hypothetical protein
MVQVLRPVRAFARHLHIVEGRRAASLARPTIWPCSCPLPAISTMSSPSPRQWRRRWRHAVTDLARTGGAAVASTALRMPRIFAARVVVGDDGESAPARRRGPSPGACRIAVAARAEHDDQAALHMRAQRGDRRLQRIGVWA